MSVINSLLLLLLHVQYIWIAVFYSCIHSEKTKQNYLRFYEIISQFLRFSTYSSASPFILSFISNEF